MEYEYQIISLPLGESTLGKQMPMQQSEGMTDYSWWIEAGATQALMHFVRLGWEPLSPLGVVGNAVSILMRKRVVVAGRAGH